MSEKKMTIRDSVPNYLLNTTKNKMRLLIDGYDDNTRTGVPLFFYRYPLYTVHAKNKEMPISNIHSFMISEKLLWEHLQVLEYLFVEAEFEKGKGLSVSIEKDIFLSKFGDWGMGALYELRALILTFLEKDESVSFNLISTLHNRTNEIVVEFSDEISSIYIIDYLIPQIKLKRAFSTVQEKNKFKEAILIRFIFSNPMAMQYAMSCDVAAQKIGFSFDGLFLNKFASMINREHRDIFVEGYGIDCLVAGGNRKIKYIKGRYSQDLHIFPKITAKKALELEECEGEEASVSSKKIPIDFESLTISTKMIDKALDMGYAKAEIENTFTVFRNTYLNIDKKYYSIGAVWSRFLKKRKGGVVKKVENRGSWSNITLNEDMREISKKYNLTKEDEIEMFVVYRNHYESGEQFRKNWVPVWENWVISNIQRKTKTGYKDKIKLETDFYTARLVSKDIELLLENQGISPADVTSGSVTLDNIGYRNYPLPPAVGKGEVTLFSWKSREAQFNASALYLGENKRTASSYIEGENSTKRIGYKND